MFIVNSVELVALLGLLAATSLSALPSAEAAASVELIELNDANQAILNLELSKATKAVQNAYKSDFNFKDIFEAKDYVKKCNYLSHAMTRASESDFNGLAAKLKALLAEPKVKATCSMRLEKLDEYESTFSLPDDAVNHLSRKKFNSLVELRQSIGDEPELKILLGSLYERLESKLTESLLKNAALDTNYIIDEREPSGWMDLDTKFKSGCRVSKVKPICQLVRRSPLDDIGAIGKDFDDLRQAIESKQVKTIESFEEMSGVSMDELTANCRSLEKQHLKAFQMVDAYLAADFLTQARIAEQCKVDQEFDFYYNLHELCKTQL